MLEIKNLSVSVGDRADDSLSLTGEGWGEGAMQASELAPSPASLRLSTSPVKGEVNRFIQRARKLRVNMTDAEKKLWKLLRSEAFSNYKFRRQHIIGKYIADFVCIEALLVIEVDGGQHCQSTKDVERTAWLESCGWHVLRFWNNDVLQNIEGIFETLQQHLAIKAQRPLSLTGEGRGEGVNSPAGEQSTLTRFANAKGISYATSPVKGEVNKSQNETTSHA